MFIKIITFVVVFTNLHAAVVPLANDTITDIVPKDFASSLNKEYKLEYFGKANWYNAYLSCLNCGMKLATINSQSEQTALEQLITEYGLKGERFWTAGNDLATEGLFSWFTTGKIFTYTNWLATPYEPDNANGTEDCVEVRGDFKWNDYNCYTEFYFICESSFGC